MIPEIGHYSLILALCMAIILGVFPIIGAHKNNQAWMSMARPLAQGQFVFIVIAFACLAYANITNDFSVMYTAEHSNSALPWQYRFAAVWGGHEGSLLLGMLMLTGWATAVSVFSSNIPQ